VSDSEAVAMNRAVSGAAVTVVHEDGATMAFAQRDFAFADDARSDGGRFHCMSF
jgi:hypothetical protein